MLRWGLFQVHPKSFNNLLLRISMKVDDIPEYYQ